MKPYYTQVPASLNCKPDQRTEIEELLAVTPRELLSDAVVAAIANGEPVSIVRSESTPEFKRIQDPLVRACFDGIYLRTIEPLNVTKMYQKVDNHEQWNDRYGSRCVIKGRPCSLRNSCKGCECREQKAGFITSLDEMHENGQDPSDYVRIRGSHKVVGTYSDPTSDAALTAVEIDELLASLRETQERYFVEYVLEQRGYSHKEIACMIHLSGSSVSRDFKAIEALVEEFVRNSEQ